MKYYEKLLELGSFTCEDLIKLTGSPSAARAVIYNYLQKGYIERVKREYYAVISLESRQPVLSRYQIGSGLFADACVSHHSAFEVYGYGNQAYYTCYIATKSRFADFDYNGVTYHRVERKDDIDVMRIGRVNVTSPEQTAVDSIRDFEKIAGLEEVVRCLLLMPGLDEKKILKCLARDGNGYLYQKCGYIFEELRNEFGFSDVFFARCEKNSSGAKRYLLKNGKNPVFNERWKLYTPAGLKQLTDKGVNYHDAI